VERVKRALFCLELLVLAIGYLHAAEKQPTGFAQHCGVDLGKATETYYADASGTGWKRYKTLQNVPELENDFGELARVWVSQNSPTMVLTEAPGQDFTAYHSYCFDRSGALTSLKYELRTAWGWAYLEEHTSSSGEEAIKKFIDENVGKEIPAPRQAADVNEALKPEIHRTLSTLPFYKLMNVEGGN
jgi:hypothetical protein